MYWQRSTPSLVLTLKTIPIDIRVIYELKLSVTGLNDVFCYSKILHVLCCLISPSATINNSIFREQTGIRHMVSLQNVFIRTTKMVTKLMPD